MKHGIKSSFNILTATFLVLGMLCGFAAEIDYKRARKYDGETVEAVMVIDEILLNEVYGSSYYATLKSVNGENCGGNIIVSFEYETDFEPFDTVKLNGFATDARKDASGTVKMNLIAKNRVLLISGNEIISYSEEAKSGFMYGIYLMRNKISERYDSVLPSGAAAYAKALFLGDVSSLSLKFQNDMSALGVTHILAVSGMHTSILAGIIIAICERLRMRRKLIAVFITAASVLFMFIAGLSPSIVRSVIMLVMSLLPAFFGRRGDSITSLFSSAFIICLFSPEKVMSCSLLLSFASCLAIVMCIPALDKSTYAELSSARDGSKRRIFRQLRKLISSVGVSFVCSLVTVPLIALYFGKTSVISVPANMVAVPISTVSMVVMIPLLFFANVPFIGSALAYIFTFLYNITKEFASAMGSLDNTTVSLRYPFFIPIIILLCVIFLYIRLSGVRRRIAFIAPFIICTVVFASSLQIYSIAMLGRSEAVYLSGKTSEGFLVVSGNDTMYIDVGIGGKALPFEGAEMCEEEYGDVSLDGFMLTHYHSGHISVIKNMLLNYKVERLYLPEPECENDSEVYENIISVSAETEVVLYKRGEDVEFGNITLGISEYTLLERSAHPVVTLEIDLGDTQILWLGSSVTESSLAYKAELALSYADAVILGHHGPKVKEEIKLYSELPENTPVITTPYSYEWKYGMAVTEVLDVNEDGFGWCRFK